MDFVVWLFLAALAAIIWGTLIERFRFIVHHEHVNILPVGSTPIKIVHISDIHLAPWQNKKIKFIESLGEQNPDLVINTGDNLGHKDVISLTIETLEPLLQFKGVFVNGSNDYYAPTLRNPLGYIFKPSTPKKTRPLATKELTDAFSAAGWLDLNNSFGQLNINGIEIGFIGVDDAHDELDDISSLVSNRKKLKNPALIIGVTHAPYMRVIEAMAANDAAIVFAGHTHGGQVRVPGIGALTTNSDLPRKHAKGISAWVFHERMMLLNVSAGLGNSIFAPVRFWNRPEVRVITLNPVKS